MFLFLIITNMTISAQLADDCVMDDGSDCPSFPSSDNGGFRDRGDTHSLRMDAMTYGEPHFPRTLSLFYMENTSVHRKVCRRMVRVARVRENMR